MQFNSYSEANIHAKKHNRQYAFLYKNVLDLTEFRHPGPQELITENIGKDITTLFEDNDHSEYAKDLCEKLKVGTIIHGKLMDNNYAVMSKEEEQLH